MLTASSEGSDLDVISTQPGPDQTTKGLGPDLDARDVHPTKALTKITPKPLKVCRGALSWFMQVIDVMTAARMFLVDISWHPNVAHHSSR